MNRLKFMDAPNDEFVHSQAHTSVGATRLSTEACFNWAYLMYDWGFPPEIEKEDWQEFTRSVPIYHEHGLKVFGYVQFSNCVYDGSYREKDWYALDPQGRHIYYYTGRFMTCLLHPEWLSHLQEMVDGILEAGADGIFFDNPWFGIQPIHFGGTWSGPAGCFCSRCRDAFFREYRVTIPVDIQPNGDSISQEYITWRAGVVTRTISSLATYSRSKVPGIVISANDYDAIMHPTFISHGVDLSSLAACQDVVMIEDFALPRFDRDFLINNAITIRTALALVGGTPLTTDPYDKGIGFDDVYSPRRIQQGIAEAAACGTAMVVKGTEYTDQDGIFTLITAEKYEPQRMAVGKIHHWLMKNASRYHNRKNIARIGLLYPEIGFKTNWDQTAAQYFGVCQILTANGFPWQVVTQNDPGESLEQIFSFESNTTSIAEEKLVYVPALTGWQIQPKPFLARHPKVRSMISKGLSWFYRAYFHYRWSRWLMDKLELPQWFLGSPYFKIPDETQQKPILNTLLGTKEVRVLWEIAPVLIEHWKNNDECQVHLVNYASHPQVVTLIFPKSVEGQILPFNGEAKTFSGKKITYELDLYDIIIYC